MKDKKSFGSFIREKRIEKNYSQKDLAQLLYVSESAVSKWERGITYPDITLISDICRVLAGAHRLACVFSEYWRGGLEGRAGGEGWRGGEDRKGGPA